MNGDDSDHEMVDDSFPRPLLTWARARTPLSEPRSGPPEIVSLPSDLDVDANWPYCTHCPLHETLKWQD